MHQQRVYLNIMHDLMKTILLVAPTPDSNYTIELHYYHRPASLTAGADSGTTWVSTNAPFALLYGSLSRGLYFHER